MLTDAPAHSRSQDALDLNPSLSDYEKLRARNIVRNNASLRSLGLISALEEVQSNALAWGLKENQAPSTTTEAVNKKKRKAKYHESSPRKMTSRRLQGLEPDGSQKPPGDDPLEDRNQRRRAMVQECREARQRAALRVMEDGAERAAKENPTATYEHCLMRVRTMTEKGLGNRVKAIERSAGKHCVVKMAIFKSCLQDEDRWDLATLAGEALERLKALQPAPEE